MVSFEVKYKTYARLLYFKLNKVNLKYSFIVFEFLLVYFCQRFNIFVFAEKDWRNQKAFTCSYACVIVAGK